MQQGKANFRGTARVKLASLQPDDSPQEQKFFLNRKNVRRLRQVFVIEGCRRLVPEHHVSALISSQKLEASIQRSGTSQATVFQSADERSSELLLLFAPLTFLHERHRLEAARNILSADDDWWTVDLYLDDE